MKPVSNELGRFLVVCDLKSGSRSAFERGLVAAGSVMSVGDKVWLLRGVGTAGSIRNTLLQYIGARDTLMVLQFAATRTATHNLGPEMDARLRAMLYLDNDVAAVSRPLVAADVAAAH
jgi:hypothetical protein